MEDMTPREETLLDVAHPDFIQGRRVVQPGTNLHELADRIKNGDPTCGWEGDPRLTLARYDDPVTGPQFELWRLEHDGQYRLVAKLAGHLDPSNICRRLVEHDIRRGFDIKDAVDRHNAKVHAARMAPVQDRLSGAADKLAWALRKDLGIRTQWSVGKKVGS